MTDKVYPSSKPAPPTMTDINNRTTTTATTAAAKPQLYNPNRRRPQPPPPRRRRCRFSCCLCVIYTLIALLSLLLLAAIAASVFYLLYHPKHPTFSLSSLRLTSFNLSSPSDPTTSSPFSHLSSSLSLTLTSKNPNPKISFLYDDFSIGLTSTDSIDVGDGTLPGFSQAPGNTTVLRGTVASDPRKDLDSVSGLRSDLGKKNGFPIVVRVDTKVEVKMGKVKSKKVGIRVTCDGIRGFVPNRNATSKKITPAVANTAAAKCKVDLRIKIWRFTF